MKVGLIDVDGHNWPNLALMKLSAWHKARGDTVEWHWGFGEYDRVYMSKVFDETYSQDADEPLNAKEIIKGGTGYGPDNHLPEEAEHIYPDYSLYPQFTKDTAYGFLTRGCPRACHFCIVSGKEGKRSRKVADLSEWWNGQKNIKLLNEENIDAINRVKLKEIHFAWDSMEAADAVLRGLELYAKLAKRRPHGRFATVYVLTNCGTSMSENLLRIYTLRDLNYDPYVMIYDKPNAPREVRLLQRWCNNRIIFRTQPDFEKFDPKRG